MMPRDKIWSDQEDKNLTKLWPIASLTMLAERFQRSRISVKRRAAKLGLPAHRSSYKRDYNNPKGD